MRKVFFGTLCGKLLRTGLVNSVKSEGRSTCPAQRRDLGVVSLESNGMPEFRIEPDALKERSETKARLLSWCIVLLLFAIFVSIWALGFLGLLSDGSDLRWLVWLSVPALFGVVVGTFILAFREALRRAEREMVFVLDEKGIVRRRKGFPEVRIPFSDVDALGEELGWLVVESTSPYRKIAVPNNVKGYEVIRAELTKHHALAPPVNKLPLKSAAPLIISFLSWVAVIWFRNVRLVIPAAVVGMTLLVLASRRLWILLRLRRERLLSLFCLGIVWFAAILLIYLRIARP